MNNMGGYKSVMLYPVDSVSVSMSDSTAVVNQSSDGISLPISSGKSAIGSTDNGDGSHLHTADITLKALEVDCDLHSFLRRACRLGVLLVTIDFNGRRHLFGDTIYPLTGSIAELRGDSPSDLHSFRLSLSSQCLHQELLVV